MAAAPKAQDPAQGEGQEIPTEFRADQLFVGVGEGMAEVVGHDGGGTTNGRGMWYKGQVGHWTSKHPVPLALRDPDNGTIWKGYVEPVTATAYGLNGVVIAAESQKFYVRPDEMPAPKKVEPKKLKVEAPTQKAAKRAKDGPAPIDAAIKASQNRPVSPLVASAGGRASDSVVG